MSIQEYVHGSPAKARKIVLNDEMLKTDPLQGLTVVHRYSVVPIFLNALASECALARDQQHLVLVLLFGHGNSVTKGIYLGLQEPEVNNTPPLLQMDALREAVGLNVQVTVLSTACYSGGWAINPRLNTTMLATSRPGPSIQVAKYTTGESEPWSASKTLGRICGSIYATAVIQALSDENAPYVNQSTQSTASSDKAEKIDAYSTFANTIYQVLFTRGDNWAADHEIRFSAEDDEWSMQWHRRTGLPLAHYAPRWASLPEIAPDPYVSWSRDPAHLDPIEDLDNVPRGAPGSREIGNGSIGGISNGKLGVMRSMVLGQARVYMASFPGRDNIASNAALHNAIARLQRGQDFDFEQLVRIHIQVEYRTKAMEAADVYVGALGFAGPGGLKCREWDMGLWIGTTEAKEYNDEQFGEMLEQVNQCYLFPHPMQQQGKECPKVNIYLAVALMVANIDRTVLLTVLKELATSR